MGANTRMLTAIFRNRGAAVRSYEWLQERGYRPEEINVLMSDRTRESLTTAVSEGEIKPGSKAAEGLAAGGAIGTAVGTTLGAVLGAAMVGTAFLIPGLNVIIAGPVLVALAAGGAGAVAGGALGALVGLGIPQSNAHAYQEALREGGVVFGVAPRSTADEKAIREHFEELGADNVVTV